MYCKSCGCKCDFDNKYLTNLLKCEKCSSLGPVFNFCITCGNVTDGENLSVLCDDCSSSDTETVHQNINIDISVLDEFINSAKKQAAQKKANNIVMLAHSKANRAPIIIYECPCDHDRKHKHHFDYTRPYEVLLLCPKCHGAEHRRLNRLNLKPAKSYSPTTARERSVSLG